MSLSGTFSGSWSGSINPSSVSTGSISCSSISAGSGSTISGNSTLGSAGSACALGGSTVGFSNIPFAANTGVAACFSGRNLQGVSSARATKENIEDLEAPVADILKMRPVSFTAKGDDSGGRHFGFISEEVDEIESLRPIVVRYEGEMQGLGYDRITALHQKVLIEFAARLTALENAA